MRRQCGGRGLMAVSSCVGVSQMAVSQKTVECPGAVAVGGAEYGGGCFLLQLGRMGMLSCLHRFFSGRCRALISRHRMRFFSMVSIMVASPQSQGICKAAQASASAPTPPSHRRGPTGSRPAGSF